jgi:hypothetical protein
MTRLGLVMNTFNEGDMIAAALASAVGVDEIVVADMGSVDATRAVAGAAGARIVEVAWSGYCETARQAAVDASTCEWVVVLDADERLSPGAVAEMRQLAARAPADVSAFSLPHPTFIGGVRINATGWSLQQERHPRLFRAADVTWPAIIHTVPSFRGRVVELPPGSSIEVTHHCFRDVEHAWAKFNRYTTVEAHEIVERNEPATVAHALQAAVDELLWRWSPDEDGAVTAALGFGLFAYKFLREIKAIELRGWEGGGPLPSRAVLADATRSWLAALTTATHAETRQHAADLVDAGDLDAAAAVLRGALAAWGDDPSSWSDLGAIEAARGRAPHAIECCDRALAIDPTHGDARHNRAVLSGV